MDKPLSQIYSQLQGTYGQRFSVRVNLGLTDEFISSLRSLLESPPHEVGGFRAAELIRVDGTKWVYEGGDWVLLRLSGTEPVARLYIEAREPDRLKNLEEAFSGWISGEGTAAVYERAGH